MRPAGAPDPPPRVQGRRAPWVFAAAVAAAVLGGGLLWPTGDGDPATAGGGPAVIEADASTSPPASPPDAPADTIPTAPADLSVTDAESTVVPAPEPADLVAVTARLLTDRQQCRGDRSCLAEVQESPERGLAPGVIDLSSEQRMITLLDECGGVAVLRAVAPADASDQLIVIVRAGERWLLRDVHDVAEQ